MSESDPLLRLVEAAPAEESAEAELAALVKSAADQRPRLGPHAVERIEARLVEVAELGRMEDARARFWRGLRAPAYVLATALVAVVLWAKLSPRLIAPAPIVVGRAVDAAGSSAPATPTLPARVVPAHPLRLETGSLEVRTERELAVVETPSARVEVAPGSAVHITVESHGVRIAAQSGSAKISYFDGHTELALPAIDLEPARTALRRGRPRPASSTEDRSARAPVISPTPASGAEATPTDRERASLLAAMSRLRSAPLETLGLLDAHLDRYPEGVTRLDAERARIAVLLGLGRKPEALAALEASAAPSTELLVMRGELRAEAQRYEEAIGDFGAVLVADEDRFAQRALFGRALCRQKLGDRERMTADLERFLLLYPRGELADRVRVELRRATSEASR